MAPMTTFIPCIVAAPRRHVSALRSSAMLGRPLRVAASMPALVTRRVYFPVMSEQAEESDPAATPAAAAEDAAATPVEPDAAVVAAAAVMEAAAAAADSPVEADADASAGDAAAAAPTTTEATEGGDDKTEDADAQQKRRRRTRPRRNVTHQLEDLTIGQELSGTVRGVMNYGAFVGDMGTPTDGLLHVSQLASGFVENVSDVVSVGDKVTVRVLAIDMEKRTFSLTMKTPEQLAAQAAGQSGGGGRQADKKEEQSKKWDDFSFDPEAFLDGKVMSLTDFGAFCQLLNTEGKPDAGVPTDGLIHISEISTERVEKVSDVLTSGDIVKVRIVTVDRKRNRISLSLKPYVPPGERSSSDRPSKKSQKEKDIEEGGSSDVVGDLARVMESQPTFKTSFELAFERANATAGN